MAKHFDREDDLILLQVRAEGTGHRWQPLDTNNLTSHRSIPFNTCAQAVVDTASSLDQSGDNGFFRNHAQTHIAGTLETLREIAADVTLETVTTYYSTSATLRKHSTISQGPLIAGLATAN